MTQQNQSCKAKLIRLQNILSLDSKPEVKVNALQQLIILFKGIDIKNEKIAKNQVYEELRDTVKNIFSYLEKVKQHNGDTSNLIQKLIKQLLLIISNFCSLFYFSYHPIGCGEMIKEFLSSECKLFVPDFNAAAPIIINGVSQPANDQEKQEKIKNWVWAKQSSFKTIFFSQCVQTIMKNLCDFQEKFGEMQVSVIGQYLRLLYYMDDHVIQDKIINLCLHHVDALEQLFQNPTKQIMKDVNKQKLEEIVEYLTKLLRYSKQKDANKRVQLLGALLGMSMLKLNSIQKKILGCKIVSKFSYQMLYRNTSYITQSSFSQWIVSQGFFELVFQDNCQTSLVKASQDTFKLLVKKGHLKKQQFQKFFSILQKSEIDLRKAMFRLIDPFRVDYHQIQTMLEIFRNIRGAEFYDDQFFYFLEGISRYSTQTQITNLLQIVESILREHYNKFENYLTKRRSMQAYSYIFQRLITYKDPSQRIQSYVKVASDFIKEPSSNRLIMLKTLFENLTQHKMDKNLQQTLCDKIVLELKFIQKSFKVINQPKYKDDLVTTIKIILKKYNTRFSKQPFTTASLLQCVSYPEIFQQMLKLINNSESDKLESLFNQLANLTAVQQFQFSCIKSVFIKLNLKNLRAIKKEYTDVIGTYVIYFNPTSFFGLQTLKYLIFNSKKHKIRQGACQLLVEVYTNLSDDFRQQGQIYLVQFMKDIVLLIRHKFNKFLQGSEDINSVQGTLQLMEQLLLNTQYFGVGSLKAHNSLIPTSTVNLKVFNNSTYGDDVLKIFQKKFPSNKTLFDVIVQVSKQFKIGPLDICLQFPSAFSIKYNGLTLQQLKLNNQELNAVKLPQSRVKKQPLLVDAEITPRALKVFTDMFNRYAPNGKMTSKQCAKYIEGVTISFCPIFDSRITSLFAEYDSDKDGVLLLEDFIKFYKECLLDPQKAEVVDKNLGNLRYRRDLKLYDEDLDSLNQQVLFRYHIWNNKDIYEILFKFTQHQDLIISTSAQALLLRLPTYPKVIESLTQRLNLKQKKPFQIEYLLTALKSQIANDQTVAQKLLKSQNHLAIFQYLSELCSKELKTSNEKNSLIISLHLLSSLLGLKKQTDTFIVQFPELAFRLPKTEVFLNIIRQSIKNGDSTLLQPAFSLQLTQKQMPFDWIQQSAFSKDKDTRYLTCGFLYLWTLKNKNKDLNLFNIKIRPTNNEQWFNFLALIMKIGIQIDYEQLFTSKITQIKSLSQSLQGLRFNPIIHGNLKLIKQIYNNLKQKQRNLLYNTLNSLMPELISNQNRELAYQLIIKDYPLETIQILQKIVQAKIGKQAHPRNKFVGIRNLGCICYMNSILQQFFMIKQFLSLITQLQTNTEQAQINGVKYTDDFLYQLQFLYMHLQWSQKQYYDPTKFCWTIKDGQGKPVNTHIQEDAHQFLNTAFDKIQTYAKKQSKEKVLQKIFGGKTVTQIICQTCKNKVEVLQHFHHLTVQVKGMKTLKESFDKLILPEEISDYFCVNCDKKVQKITKQTLIKQSPEILIINLQRIVFDLQTFLKVKVHTKLQFQQNLDLHNYFSSSTKPAPYKLKGVVIHSGTSEGGHYYSLIKQEEKWYKFNDQSVTSFNEIDLGRQAFGGEQQIDTLGDLTSSTNAYILLYERVKNSDEVNSQQQKRKVNQKMYQQVIKQNQEFKNQIQMYQNSFFLTLNNLFEKYINSQEKNVLERLFKIYLKVIQHLAINSDVKTQIINQLKDNFLKLCTALPNQISTIAQFISKQSFGQIICTNNDVNIRQVYAKILVKILIISIQNNSCEIPQNQIQTIEYLFSLLQNDMLVKNIFKSHQFFEVWKQIVNSKPIKQKMLEKQCLTQLLELLLGIDSIHSTKQKKRSEFSVSEAIPLIPVVTNLLKNKLNLKGLCKDKDENQKYIELTERQRKILNDSLFYRKMMKNKIDMGLLYPIIELLCYKDQQYSKFILEVLLKALNSNDQIEDKTVVFTNLKAYFLIDDEFTSLRMEWGLGIAQIDSISFTSHQFGMMTSAQSKVYSYVSSLFFVKDEKLMPLLSTLFEKRKYFNSFSVQGVIMLLELVNQFNTIREYIFSLPAPSYVHKIYLDWIETFTLKIKTQQHYGLPYQKNVLVQKLHKLIDGYKQAVHKLSLSNEIPVNKKIIGKNATVILRDCMNTDNYSIQLWAHQTYVLINRPYGMGNFQLPDQEFSFVSTVESAKAKYFLKSQEIVLHQVPINLDKQWTVMTFSIKTSISLVVEFNVKGFEHTIYLKSGQNTIYTPFDEGTIQQLMKVIEIKQEIALDNAINQPPVAAPDNNTSNNSFITNGAGEFSYNNYMQVSCKECTYLNVGVNYCEICGNDLFK